MRGDRAATGCPAYVTGVGAKGSVIYSPTPVREYRDALGIDERITYLAWLFQQSGGVFKSPWSKQETWTLSVWHSDEDVRRYVDNFEAFATGHHVVGVGSRSPCRRDHIVAFRKAAATISRPTR